MGGSQTFCWGCPQTSIFPIIWDDRHEPPNLVELYSLEGLKGIDFNVFFNPGV
jgi:hypothetical protein